MRPKSHMRVWVTLKYVALTHKKYPINIKYIIVQLYRLSSSLCYYNHSNNTFVLKAIFFIKCFHISHLVPIMWEDKERKQTKIKLNWHLYNSLQVLLYWFLKANKQILWLHTYYLWGHKLVQPFSKKAM